MLKNYLKTPRKGSRRRFERVLKMYMKREVSWDRFFIDFGTILGGPGQVKMWFSLRRGSNFEVFASSNISYLLESKKTSILGGFWGSSWVPKMCNMGPRGLLGRSNKLFWGSQRTFTNESQKICEKIQARKKKKINKIWKLGWGSLKSNQSRGSTGPT